MKYSNRHYPDILVRLFDDTFYHEYNTRLVYGEDEPVYLPANDEVSYHRIVFAHGFFASALHEIAHWCIAGEERRQQVDYGYWYAPDGRTEAQQKAFETVEVKPQAIEWAFSIACDFPFNFSLDNLNGAPCDELAFKSAVAHQLSQMLNHGFPKRAEQFIKVLRINYFPQSIARPLTRAQRTFKEVSQRYDLPHLGKQVSQSDAFSKTDVDSVLSGNK